MMGEHEKHTPAAGDPGWVDPGNRSPGPRLARLGRLIRKELCEILRDRRTIFTLVLMPLLLYPLLSMAFHQFLLAGFAHEPVTEYRIAIPAPPGRGEPETAPLVQVGIDHYLALGNFSRALRAAAAVSGPAGAGPFSAAAVFAGWRELDEAPVPLLRLASASSREQPPRVLLFTAANLEEAVRSRSVDLGIRVRRTGDRPGDLAEDWEVLYLRDSPRAQEVLALVEGQLTAANARFLQRVLRHLDVPQRPSPVRVFRTPLGETQTADTVSLAALVPLILILMTITGAVYPAIDLTAGERERGTLEILVAAPVPRLALLFAKYVSVVTVAVLTALVNLVMMTVTVQLSGLGDRVFGGGLTALLVVQVFGLLLLFAAFFSAVLLTLTSFARSFKEAQAYLIPLMLVSLAPGLLGMMPGLELTGLNAVTPLLNIVLLARDLFGGKAEAGMAAVVVFSTLGYAVAALSVAARFFGAEAVLYSEQSGWSDLFRRPARPRPAPTPSGAMLTLAVIFPVYFVLASLTARAAPEKQALLQVGVTLLLFVVIPLLAAARGRVELGSGFRLRGASWVAFPAAALLGVSLFPPVYELLVFLRNHGLTFLGPRHEELLRRVIGESRTLPALIAVGTAALTGALEEPFFRGYLFSALRSVGRPAMAVLGSAVVFGLFHSVSWFDRFVPSTLMGVVLGWVCWRTGSILPGMLLHACYNALWFLLAYYQQTGSTGSDHLPPEWLAAAALGLVIGVGLIRFVGQDSNPDKSLSGLES